MRGSTSNVFLMSLALKSLAVFGVAWATVFFLRRRSAGVRHLVWSAAFAALLILPILSLALPPLHTNIAGVFVTSGPVFETDGSAAALKSSPHIARQSSATPLLKSSMPFANPLVWLPFVWALGTTISFAQMFIGWISMLRLRRRARAFPISNLAALPNVLGKERVEFLETPARSMPLAYGVFRPAIFLPADVATWNPERRRIVLLHELAHIHRRDNITHLLARAALALYWWNPLVWIAWREFLKERERAADDLVLTAGAAAPDYATHLLDIARSMQLSVALGSSAIAMARRSQLEGRLLSILDPRRDRRSPNRTVSSLAWLLAIGMIAPLAAVRAQNDAGQGTVLSHEATNSVSQFLVVADRARDQQQFAQARSLYAQALASLHGGPQAATILIRLGTVELATKNFNEAVSDFQKASRTDPAKTGEARMWNAISEQQRNNLDTADALYQSALTAQDPDSPDSATAMELYAQLLQQQNRSEESARMRHQAANIRKAQGAQILSKMHAASPDVHRVGGNTSAPVLSFKAESEYTEEARIAKYQGTALLYTEIGTDGLAHRTTAIRPLAFGLTEKAIEAVSQWKFKPGTKDGEPVPVAATIEVNFRLK